MLKCSAWKVRSNWARIYRRISFRPLSCVLRSPLCSVAAVALNKDVSIDSYFQIMPQYKSRSIGEIVYSGDPIYLKCCGGTGDFFLRASNKFKIHEDPDYGFIDFSAHSPSYERRLKDNRRMSNAQIALHRPHKWSDAREVNASSKVRMGEK